MCVGVGVRACVHACMCVNCLFNIGINECFHFQNFHWFLADVLVGGYTGVPICQKCDAYTVYSGQISCDSFMSVLRCVTAPPKQSTIVHQTLQQSSPSAVSVNPACVYCTML